MFLELAQNTADWYTWRNTGIGASEAAAIAGYWNDYESLWNRKVASRRGMPERKFSNRAMEWGHLHEPAAKVLYTELTGIETRPVCCTHDDLQWCKASLDGWSDPYKVVLEAKCPFNPARHQAVADSRAIPAYYYPQLQHQLFCSGGRLGHFISYDPRRDDHTRLVLVEVLPDPEYTELLIELEFAFWRSVLAEEESRVDIEAHRRLDDLYRRNHLNRLP